MPDLWCVALEMMLVFAASPLTADAYSGAKLGSTGYTNYKDKKRRLQLHHPDEDVTFEFTGKL